MCFSLYVCLAGKKSSRKAGNPGVRGGGSLNEYDPDYSLLKKITRSSYMYGSTNGSKINLPPVGIPSIYV